MKRSIILHAIAIFLLAPALSFAAELSILSNGDSAEIGATVPLRLLISSEGGPINAFSGSVRIPDGADVVSIDISDSIVPLWITEPAEKDGEIVFAAMIPGGFEGVFTPYSSELEPGALFTAYVRLKKEGKLVFAPRMDEVYRNDGLGTPVDADAKALAIDVRSEGPYSQGLLTASKAWIILGLSIFAVIAYLLWRR